MKGINLFCYYDNSMINRNTKQLRDIEKRNLKKKERKSLKIETNKETENMK